MEHDHQNIQICFGMSPSMATLLQLLMQNKIVTGDMVRENNLSDYPKMAVYRLRIVLDEHGIDVQSKQNIGYWLEAKDREKIREMLDQTEKELTPDSVNIGA